MWPFSTSPPRETRAETTSHFLLHGGEVRSIANPDASLLEIFGLTSSNGVPAGRSGAFKFSASAACLRLISGLAAEAPMHAYRRVEGGGRERVRDHPVERLLNDRANPWTPSPRFVRNMLLEALFEGESFARVIRAGRDKQPRELHQIFGVTVEYDQYTGEPSYLVQRKGGGQERLSWRDVIHLQSPTGSAPVKQSARAIELGLQLELLALNLLRNGGRPSGILSIVGRALPETAKKVRDQWEEDLHNENMGRVAVMGSEVKFEPLEMTAVDAGHLENRKTQVLEVARFFGVSPTLVGQLEDASLNNSAELGRQFVRDTLSPWLTEWTGAISQCLIPDTEPEIYAEPETGGLVRADLKSRFEALRLAIGGPWMVPNEGRALENMNAVEDGNELNAPQGAAAQNTPNSPQE